MKDRFAPKEARTVAICLGILAVTMGCGSCVGRHCPRDYRDWGKNTENRQSAGCAPQASTEKRISSTPQDYVDGQIAVAVANFYPAARAV